MQTPLFDDLIVVGSEQPAAVVDDPKAPGETTAPKNERKKGCD